MVFIPEHLASRLVRVIYDDVMQIRERDLINVNLAYLLWTRIQSRWKCGCDHIQHDDLRECPLQDNELLDLAHDSRKYPLPLFINTCNFCSLPTVDVPFGILIAPHPLAIPHGRENACGGYYEPLVARALKLLLIDGVTNILGAPPLDSVTNRIVSAPTIAWLRTPWVSDKKKGTPFFYNVHLLVLIEHFCHSDIHYTPYCNLVNFPSRQKRGDSIPLTHLNYLDAVYTANPNARRFKNSAREIWNEVGQGMGPIAKAPGHRYKQIAPRSEPQPGPSSVSSPSIAPSSPPIPSKRPRNVRSVSPHRDRAAPLRRRSSSDDEGTLIEEKIVTQTRRYVKRGRRSRYE